MRSSRWGQTSWPIISACLSVFCTPFSSQQNEVRSFLLHSADVQVEKPPSSSSDSDGSTSASDSEGEERDGDDASPRPAKPPRDHYRRSRAAALDVLNGACPARTVPASSDSAIAYARHIPA